MADFISGADLVARGAEGTGAATIVNNQSTLQNLARLSGKMDNLYKTKEAMNLKLAAAKAAAKDKQPGINYFASGAVLGENVASNGNIFLQGIQDIRRNRYNQKLSQNDIAGANQEAADAAADAVMLNAASKNADDAIKSSMAQMKGFYRFTPEVISDIQSKFPSFNQQEFAKITDPAKKEEYFINNARNFTTIDPQQAIRQSTLFNPNSYDYNGILENIQARLQTKSIKVEKANGTGYANNSSELLDNSGKLDYNKAQQAILQLPEAKMQMQYVSEKAGNDLLNNPTYQAITDPKQKEAKMAETKEAAVKKYIGKVFAIGLERETAVDQTTFFGEERAKQQAQEKPLKVVNGQATFNYNGAVYKYDKDRNFVLDQERNYPVSSATKVVLDNEFKVAANAVMIPIGRWNADDKEALGATKYKSLPGAANNLWVANKGANTSYAARVKLPMFTTNYRDPITGLNYKAGDFVPDELMEKRITTATGKEEPLIANDNYMLVSGHVADPIVETKAGLDASGNARYEKAATTQNFYPDYSSFNLLNEQIRKSMGGSGSGTVFSGR